MAYVYQTEFDIRHEQMNLLEIGAALERALGYLRTLLPSETGYITARAMYSLTHDEYTHIIFQSEWDYWEDLENHRLHSYLDEDKLLVHFQPHVDLANLTTHIYSEIP
jgi:hypothetical protein